MCRFFVVAVLTASAALATVFDVDVVAAVPIASCCSCCSCCCCTCCNHGAQTVTQWKSNFRYKIHAVRPRL